MACSNAIFWLSLFLVIVIVFLFQGHPKWSRWMKTIKRTYPGNFKYYNDGSLKIGQPVHEEMGGANEYLSGVLTQKSERKLQQICDSYMDELVATQLRDAGEIVWSNGINDVEEMCTCNKFPFLDCFFKDVCIGATCVSSVDVRADMRNEINSDDDDEHLNVEYCVDFGGIFKVTCVQFTLTSSNSNFTGDDGNDNGHHRYISACDRVTFGGPKCQCDICKGGLGLSIDCSAYERLATTNGCQSVDYLDSGVLIPFVPAFDGTSVGVSVQKEQGQEQGQQVPEPEAGPEPEPEPEPQPQPQPQPDSESDLDPALEPDLEPDSEPNPESDSEPDAEPDSEPDLEPDPETQQEQKQDQQEQQQQQEDEQQQQQESEQEQVGDGKNEDVGEEELDETLNETTVENTVDNGEETCGLVQVVRQRLPNVEEICTCVDEQRLDCRFQVFDSPCVNQQNQDSCTVAEFVGLSIDSRDVLTFTNCITYTEGSVDNSLEEVCIAVALDIGMDIEECLDVTYGNNRCECRVCEDRRSILLDCGAYNRRAVTEECQVMDFERLGPFIPDFSSSTFEQEDSTSGSCETKFFMEYYLLLFCMLFALCSGF